MSAIGVPAVVFDGCWTNVRTPGPGTFVRVKVADPAPVAVTWNVPATVFAVIAGDVAMPSKPVATVAGMPVTLGPFAGGVNVTDAPETVLPKLSVTLACSGWYNVATVDVCPLPS